MIIAPDAPARPALRYHGAKWRAASWIVACLPEDHDSYIEPFGGSAAVLLNKPRSPIEVYNDLDGEVVNFFRILRERPEDIPLLVRHFVQQLGRKTRKKVETIPSETMNALARYDWPGNIRELQNLIERALILTNGPVLRVPLDGLRARSGASPIPATRTLREAEREHVLAVLEETGWVLGGPNGAAARLGLNRSTLQFRLKRLGIVRPDRRGAPERA